MADRTLKDTLYPQFARIGHALASGPRLEILDVLAQGEKNVERLAHECGQSLKNVSAHLRVLRSAGLVVTRREGTFINYRLAGTDVAEVVRKLQEVARRRLAEVERAAAALLEHHDDQAPVTLAELRRMMREGTVTLIDVRPPDEFAAGHIPGALSVPLLDLNRKIKSLPKRRPIVAYCRGPYCLYALTSVLRLRRLGYSARRTTADVVGWQAIDLVTDLVTKPTARRRRFTAFRETRRP